MKRVGFVLVLLATMWGFSPVNAQTATDDAVVSSATEVVVAPAAGSMSVTNTYEVAATGSDPLDEFEDWLPADAQGVETSSGSAVPTGEVTDGLVAWRVTLDEEIESGLSATVSLTYDLDLDGSPNDFAFAHPGLVSIAPTATAASTSLRVQVPGSWEVLEAAPGYGALDDGQSVFVADQPDPYLSQTLVLRSDAGFDTTSLESTVADLTVVFPAGVSVSAGTGLVALVDGLAAWLPLDPPDGFVVEYGYQTSGRDGVVVVDVDASQVEVARAVAAAWLEPLPFVDRFLRQDLAGAIADRVARGQGRFAAPSTNRWSETTAALVAVSDEATIASVLDALDSGASAYGGSVDQMVAATIDWRRVLDVSERIGGIESAEAAFELAATPPQLAELEQRAVAVAAFGDAETAAAPWSLPPLLRVSIEAWDFETFTTQHEVVSELITQRDAMIVEADEVGLGIGDVVRNEFEQASELDNLPAELLATQQDALHDVAEALRLDTGDRGLLSQLGMAGRPAAEQLADMRASWDDGEFVLAAMQAETLIEDYESSVGRGTLRLLGPLLVGALALAGYRRLVERWFPTPDQTAKT